MKRFLQSKVGLISVCVFLVFMAFMSIRVFRQAPALASQVDGASRAGRPPETLASVKGGNSQGAASRKPETAKMKPVAEQQEELLYLDRMNQPEARSSKDRDSNGLGVTRRRVSASLAKNRTAGSDDSSEGSLPAASGALRLSGRPGAALQKKAAAEERTPGPSTDTQDFAHMADNPLCFVPYGRPIKCELVFAVDSTMDQTPLVGLVMEPVYNNGFLVIPAGSELHGMARPDRQRDRIFSSPDWVLILPRDGALPNGRQLSLRGLALDRIEPQASGLTWGLTDGSYGLQGEVIKSAGPEEIKRFVATFISAGALGLQQTENNARGAARIAANARNATLEGLSASLEEWSRKIGEEIERNGVFIRIAGGKQFYFYPQQTIVPSRAEIPK